MEYYRKYSHNTNLEQYFSVPGSSATSEEIKYYYSLYEINPKLSGDNLQTKDFNLKSCVPKERRRWVRPPLIGQSSGNDATSGMYVRPLADPQSSTSSSPPPPPPSHDINRITPETILEERNECQETPPDIIERKVPSPTSSVTSHKPLEWDSGADVGYFPNTPNNKQDNKKLSTIERMALARGCSAALRLDPEGTTESGKIQSGRQSSKSMMMMMMKPDANSTAIVENISGSESEIEITPIVKNHLPGVITGNDIKSDEKKKTKENPQISIESICETPKTSGLFKMPLGSPVKSRKQNPINFQLSPLKKSSSMNIIAMPGAKVPLKRSQSDLNLHAGDKNKALPRLIFNSTSSIATVVNKPITCDKLIQTTLKNCSQESVGIQVSVVDEEKPPLPKRGTSLNKKLQSILKNSQNTYKVPLKRNELKSNTEGETQSTTETESDSSAATPQLESIDNVPGRANSFEYFPGHIYENVPNGSGASHVSSISTGRSNSTMPNTSSSIDEKLWGESDSLVRDLERSVNILKSLVDANKCDKTVKKRLIHHVVKRLVTAKYKDDKIEHNLEENVPWNPDDARKKVYRAEIIQALAKKQNTTDSSDDWKFQRVKTKKATESVTRALKEMINESSNSEKFDRNTDRTEMDGRKARMGLRADDCDRSTNTPTDHNKSESSECFMPQRNYKKITSKNMFMKKKKCETTTSNSSPADQNRATNEEEEEEDDDEEEEQETNNHDWRLPTTISERNFELRRCSNSDSADSKLVSYAEMEKKNQLIWITNEISHLSNLKKLLEQPKKLERVKKIYKTRHCIHENTKSNSLDSNSLENWSSHCNLASCHNKNKKRNSFTQTATEISNAHSKTSGIITIEYQNQPVKLVNIGLQTNCPVYQTCQKCSNEKKYSSFYRKNNTRPVITIPLTSSPTNNICADFARLNLPRNQEDDENNSKQKDTKNHLNASRSKFICDCSQNCRCQFKSDDDEKPMKCKKHYCISCSRKIELHSRCDECEINKIHHQSGESYSSDKSESIFYQGIHPENGSSFQSQTKAKYLENSESGKKTNCQHCCDEKKEKQEISNGYECRVELLQRKEQTRQPYYLTNEEKKSSRQFIEQNNFKCRCEKDCVCSNKLKDNDERLSVQKYSTRREYSNKNDERLKSGEKNCKCCRTCGKTYQKNRKCDCTINYPKSVAYELTFMDENKDKKNVSKSENEEIKGLGKASSSNSFTARSGTCSCEDSKQYFTQNKEKKITLQECLASNKPRFLDNIETRQQYLNEISHLREMKKEKRVQLLAMASSSSLLKPTKSTKSTSHVQRKLTTADMKERLRRRYMRLSEVRSKRRQLEKQEEFRRNNLMAKIYGKKLQQKVLQGQVDLSQSVSVISNL
ncbi:uncharacterized protein LOC127283709 isoform X2 [Leptopilina boulardi]|nr:uncharacterized protein LOC127283709 isoform X2 [Leptopilina boulardi]